MTRPSNNQLLAVAERHWPKPRLRTRARQTGQRWATGGARWAWTHRPRRQAVGLIKQERQP